MILWCLPFSLFTEENTFTDFHVLKHPISFDNHGWYFAVILNLFIGRLMIFVSHFYIQTFCLLSLSVERLSWWISGWFMCTIQLSTFDIGICTFYPHGLLQLPHLRHQMPVDRLFIFFFFWIFDVTLLAWGILFVCLFYFIFVFYICFYIDT